MQTAVIQNTVPQGQNKLGRARILLASGQVSAALAAILPELQRRADDPALLDVAAMCYWRLDDGPTALALMQVITEGWPKLVDGWTKRAAIAASRGDTDARSGPCPNFCLRVGGVEPDLAVSAQRSIDPSFA